MSSDKNGNFQPSNLNHPEMMFSSIVSRLQSPSSVEQTSVRHPAIPEEADGLTDLYEVMPDLMRPEAVLEISSKVVRKDQQVNARWQHRSNSLPVTHGNFILLNRERRPPAMLSRPSKSRFLIHIVDFTWLFFLHIHR